MCDTHPSSESSISCSQKRRTRQPKALSSSSTSLSRSTFLLILSIQNSTLFLGCWKCLGHLCQKQPSTNMASFFPGKIMSGRPGSLFLSLYLSPADHSALRKINSGLVFFPRILDMQWLRCLGVKMSINLVCTQ